METNTPPPETPLASAVAELDATELNPMRTLFASMTPEQRQKHDAECERRNRDAVQARHESKVYEMRTKWNAPKRQCACKPIIEGEWAEKLNIIKAKLETANGFTIALVGSRGSGKTQLAVECMRLVTKQEKSALFTTAVGFFMEIKAAYKKDSSDDERDVLQKFRRPALLVIDEIGKRGETDWENTMLFELLNYRYNDMVATILIDNRPASDFVSTIGPSIASRMNEGGGIIECNWKSFRE